MHIRLKKEISNRTFIISHLVILTLGLLFLGGLHYILNIQYQESERPFEAGPVTTPLKSLRLDLDQPDDDTLTFENSIIVSGESGPNLLVLISQDSKDLVVKSDSSGKFQTILNLNEGVNNIKVVVFDQTGDNRSEQRTVYYSKEKI